MSEALIQIGVVGCADIARKVSRAINLSPNATICAAASRSYDKASTFAAANGYPLTAKVYGNYEALLEDPDVDAVYMPLPTSLHLRWAVLAAQNKKHLLLEKPVALNVAEFDEITLACQSNGVQFMDNTMWVHNPRTAAMSQVFNDKNRFGQLKSVNFTFILLFYMHCIFVLPYGFGPLGVLTFQRSFAKESHIY
jgi:predicted dehydrogenase